MPGTEAPDAPPEVSDQFVVLVVFHVPLPPTQYLVTGDAEVNTSVTAAPELLVEIVPPVGALIVVVTF